MKMFLFVAFFLLIMTIGIAYATYVILRLYFKFHRLNQYGQTTKGIIKKFDILEGKHMNTYVPVVQFRTYSGVDVLHTPLQTYNETEFHNSRAEVKVIYLESNPKIFIIEGQKPTNFLLFVIPVMFVVGLYTYNLSTEAMPNWVNETIQYFKNFSL